MTFAIARKFGNRIVMLADTMITYHHKKAVRNDVIPGQLKAIVLSPTISIVYAGAVDIALEAATACKGAIGGGAGLDDVLDILAAASRVISPDTGRAHCDFLLASHENGAQLLKIVEGRVSAPQDVHWVGNRDLIDAIRQHSDRLDEGYRQALLENPQLSAVVNEEHRFRSGFTHLLLRDPQAAVDVGGFVVNLLASPHGHCYQPHAGMYRPGPIGIGGEPHPEAPAEGGDRYGYSFLDGGHRGVAIAGVFVEEAGVGYIYDPLNDVRVVTMRGTTHAALADELRTRARLAGGIPEAAVA